MASPTNSSDGESPRLRGGVLWAKIKQIACAIFVFWEVEGDDIPFHWYSASEVSEYFYATRNTQGFDAMDDKTYKDLDGTSYSSHLLCDRSIFARQFFEQRFRCGADTNDAHFFGERVLRLSTDGAALASITASVKQLLKVQQEVASVLFRVGSNSMPAEFARLRYLDLLGITLFGVFAMVPVIPTGALLLAYIAVSLFVQVRCYQNLKTWTNKRKALQQLVDTALSIQTRQSSVSRELLSPILMDRDRLEKVAEAMKTGLLARSSVVAEYANLLFLYEYARANSEYLALGVHLEELKAIYEAVSCLELQLAIAQRVRAGLSICLPTESHEGQVSFTKLVHPLIATPAPLDIETRGRSLFISGQNGVGKSTLLRAVGLSVAAFRAFGYAHAQAAVLPMVAVWSSIQVDDSVEQGRSLYMSELARASQLLEVGKSVKPVVFLVDELFRGTNYLESVAASASVLHALAEQNILFATSHNVVLATLLRTRVDPVRLVSDKKSGLWLEPGVLATTNGVELMKAYNFESSIIQRAGAIANWYCDYISHPSNVLPDLFVDQ